MGLEQLPTNREFLKLNKALPDHLQQCTVVLEFAKPMPRFRVEMFYRIRLTQPMLQLGETDFWKPELMQPQKVGQQRCLACRTIMKRVGVMSSTCTHPVCPNSGMITITGPKRGVHSVKVEFAAADPTTKAPTSVSFVVGREWMTVSEDVWLSIGANVLKKKGYSRIEKARGEDNPFDVVRGDDVVADAILNILVWEHCKIPTDMVSGCLLVLDRRYNEQCLVAVHRTAGMICDEVGGKLK